VLRPREVPITDENRDDVTPVDAHPDDDGITLNSWLSTDLCLHLRPEIFGFIESSWRAATRVGRPRFPGAWVAIHFKLIQIVEGYGLSSPFAIDRSPLRSPDSLASGILGRIVRTSGF
jgi:hypothetical protein